MRRILQLPGIDLSGREVFEIVHQPTPVVASEEVFCSADIDNSSVSRSATCKILSEKGEIFEGAGEKNEDIFLCTSQRTRMRGALDDLSKELSTILQNDTPKKTAISSPIKSFSSDASSGTSSSALLFGKWIDVEQRISCLESAIGPNTSSSSAGSIQDVILRIEKRLAILDSSNCQIDEIVSHVRILERELDKIVGKEEQYSNLTNVGTVLRINGIYEVLKRFEAISPQVPVILDRLLAVKACYDDRHAIEKSLNSQQESSDKIDAALDAFEVELKEQEKAFAFATQNVSRQMESLDLQMSQLNAKIVQLEEGNNKH